MPEELKLCPACEKNNGVCIARTTSVVTYAVYCHNKDCEMRGPKRLTQEEAFAAWNALPRSPHVTPNDADCAGCPERRDQGLVWTKEPPTVPGWYWLYEESSPSRPVEVVPFGPKGIMHIHGYTEMQPVASIMGWWAGPLLRPEEPVS